MKTYHALPAILLSMVIAVPPSLAQFDGAIWDTLTWDNSKDVLCKQALCGTQDRILLAYSKGWHTPDWHWEWEVHYLVYDAVSGWSEDAIVGPGYAPAITAVDTPSWTASIFFESADLDIYGAVVHSPEEPWSPVNLTNSPAMDRYPTVAIDSLGAVHCTWITYRDTAWKTAYGKLVGDSLAVEIIEESYLGDYGEGAMPLIVTVSGLPHIFYRGGDFWFGYRIWHSYRELRDGPWVTEVLATENAEDSGSHAVVDRNGDIHLSISGDMGSTTVSHIYYLRRDHLTGQWSAPLLISDLSMAGGNIALTGNGAVYVVSSGASGDMPTGDIYLSRKSDDHFETEILGNSELAIQPVITFLAGAQGALASYACIHGPEVTDYEIVFYGPTPSETDEGAPLPWAPLIHSCYPNPFNSGTVITVKGQHSGVMAVDIFDSLGRRIRSLRPHTISQQGYDFFWDGMTDGGTDCPSGTYFYRIDDGGRDDYGKATLLK